MLTQDFLRQVVTAKEGYFCLALREGSQWLEEWHTWPADIDEIVARAEAAKAHANVYFSSYLFKAPQSTRANVLPTRTIQADLDDASLDNLPKPPTILVETSPGRHQGYWILDKELDLDEHEQLSRKLTYAIPLCDRSGWPLGRKVRLPNTSNYKYLSGPKPVTVAHVTGSVYPPEVFEALPEVPQFLSDHFDDEFIEHPTEVNVHPLVLLDRIKERVPVRIYTSYGVRQEDRSEALWALLCWSFKAGLTRAETFTLAKASANNKFGEIRHRGDQDLAKDVLRAELAVKSGTQDVRQAIYDQYKTDAPAIERKRAIFALVLKTLKENGELLHAEDDTYWYVRRDLGRPITVSPRADMLKALLDVQFGINGTEPESRYVMEGLTSYVSELPPTAHVASLSVYDTASRHLLLHTGKKIVVCITADSVESVTDGAYGVVFPWQPSVEPFTPTNREPLDWGLELFGNGTRGYGSSVDNLINMQPQHALALLKVWFMFLLFRDLARARPILASLGQPGSGKSVMFKKIYAVLYGSRKSISGVTNMDDFDHAVAADPLVVLDNVDTWEKWLPDRIAISAATSDVTKRKLWTDTDTITLRRTAMLGLNAHNPKFGREDVADRFLLLSCLRLDNFVSEELILGDILAKRNRIWGAIVHDVQNVLRTPMPTRGIPQFRIEDFARFGTWIAQGLGIYEDFVRSISGVSTAQQSFTLEEDGLLSAAVQSAAAHTSSNGHIKWLNAAQLWLLITSCSDEPQVLMHTYRNSVHLSKKLSSMQAALKHLVRIEQRAGSTGAREWLIAKKGDTRDPI